MNFNTLNIPLTQCYLEMARSISYANVRHNNEIKELEEIDRNSSFIISLASHSTIYSYMAIESFLNYGLYKLWKDSRENHDRIEEINKLFPNQKCVPLFDEFYNQYGKENNFLDLKNTEINTSKEKIKLLCREYNFPQIHETNPKLWQDFLNLLEKTRDFLVHPIPEEEIFNKFCRQLLNTEISIKAFPIISADIIRHFYISSKRTPPTFLDKNELFFFPEIVKM